MEKIVVVVKGILFECEFGKVYVLLGLNGVGKIIIMCMLLIIFWFIFGKIEINGVDVVVYLEEVCCYIGFLIGLVGLYVCLIFDEFIDYFGKFYGMK